jgi:outer membrane receptor protein involved in Fe transport
VSRHKLALFGAAATAAIFAVYSNSAMAAEATATATAEAASGGVTIGEVVVTANKRQENIQNVGASVVAASGDKLTQLGITDTAALAKIVPGFNVTPNYYGTNVFTIRGVGFQDTSLASSPTVTVYSDEMPLPFSILSAGATLDLQRVEVLKGPQGTLFGNNATGGAINYIANKPTSTFQAGLDVTAGNYSTANIQGFVSGPLTDTLSARLAVQSNNSGSWQQGYGPQAGQAVGGGTDFLNGRFSLQWKPTDRFKALFTVNGWHDRSFNQIGQYQGSDPDRNQPLDPLEAAFPLPPANDRAADWQSCVNTSPFDPISGQDSGTLYYTPYYPDGTKVTSGPTTGIVPAGQHPLNSESEGAGSLAQTGGVPTSCVQPRRNQTYLSFNLRMDYDLGNNMVVTSLTDFQKFNRDDAVDGAGVPYNTYQSIQKGKITSIYQELRISGKWFNKGSWIVGANYEHDETYDHFLQTYNGSQSSPVSLPGAGNLCGPYNPAVTTNNCTSAESATILQGGVAVSNPAYNSTLYPLPNAQGGTNFTLGPTAPTDRQQTDTYAVYASGEYPIMDNLSLVGGVRFTQEDKSAEVCGDDGGDGTYADDAVRIANLLQYVDPTGYINTTYGGASQSNPINGFISPTDAYLNEGGDAVNPGPGGCTLIGPGPSYIVEGTHLPTAHLNENNVAWKAGLNWKVQPETLLYVTISQGYKGGAFPTIAETELTQNAPARQESLLSYEVGFKGSWLEHQLQLDGAFFYYDYDDKQILGAVADPVFGALAELVNVPHSHVIGFELSGILAPEFLRGLTLTPSVSYQNSRIDGCPQTVAATASGSCKGGDYFATTAFPQTGQVDVTGEHYPDAPVWEATLDAEYDWRVTDNMTAFVGLNAIYNDKTFTGFTDPNPGPHFVYPQAPNGIVYNDAEIPAYAVLDLRAGVQLRDWRIMVWGHNVTNTYYWTSWDRVNDTNIKYTGMPTTYGITLSYRFH